MDINQTSMPSMEPGRPGTSPRVVTSKRKITYRESSWKVHQFQVWSGEPVGRVLALRLADSLLLWVGGVGARQLGDVALAMPTADGSIGTTLLAGGADAGEAMGLARRTAAALRRPVLVCCALPLDRFTAPLLDRALSEQIRLHPERFHT